ncbi:MAG: GGDEF domain-containing protein [Cloacibacillus sp.]
MSAKENNSIARGAAETTASKRPAAMRRNYKALLSVALKNTDITIIEFNIKESIILRADGAYTVFPADDVPESFIRCGIIAQESADEARRITDCARRGDYSAEGELLIKKANGKMAWHSVKCVAKGKAAGTVYFVLTDITERRALEERHQSQLAYFEELFGASDAFCLEFNITKGVVLRESLKGTLAALPVRTSYDEYLAHFANHVPDEWERERLLDGFSRGTLVNAHRFGISEFEQQYRHRHETKGLIWVNTRVKLLPDPITGDLMGFSVTHNIDDSKISSQMLSVVAHEYDYLAYVDAKNDTYKILCSEENEPFAPPAHGESYSSTLAAYNQEAVAPEDYQRVMQMMSMENVIPRLEESGRYSLIATVMEDGAPRTKRISFAYLDRADKIVLISRIDITDSYRQFEENRRLRHASRTDPLTGLYNREGILHAIERFKCIDGVKWLFFIDLDNFKNVNDALGHLEGDDALRTAAAALRDAAGPKRQLARLGGDEFVVLAHGSSDEEIRALAEQIRAALALTFENGESRVSISASVGVTSFFADEEPDAVLKRADEALYRAKHEGKDRVCLS